MHKYFSLKVYNNYLVLYHVLFNTSYYNYLFQSPYNTVRYQATGSSDALKYFAVNSVEGIVSAQRSLMLDESKTNTYLVCLHS